MVNLLSLVAIGPPSPGLVMALTALEERSER